MTGLVLTTASTIQCPHGGLATLLTSNTQVKVDGAAALLVSDTHSVVGCPFMIGTKPSPCIQITWTLGALKLKVGGTAVLVKNSIGKCLSAENAPQGVALKVSVQSKAKSG